MTGDHWRVFIRNQTGGERHIDVEGYGWSFLRAAHQQCQRGEWIDRWQPLIVPTLGNRYPLHHRARVAIRRATRSVRRRVHHPE